MLSMSQVILYVYSIMNSSLLTIYTQTLTKSVLKEDAKYRYKVDAVKKFCTSLISQFRTEERRRVSV